MPETAHLTPFDSETGRQAGLRSAQVRLELLENGKRYRELLPEQTDAMLEVQRQIDLSNEQIAHTRAELNAKPTTFCPHCEQGGAMPGNHRAALLRELRGLMEHLCRLRGIPDVGALKPSQPKARQAQTWSAPTPVEPAQGQGSAGTSQSNP